MLKKKKKGSVCKTLPGAARVGQTHKVSFLMSHSCLAGDLLDVKAAIVLRKATIPGEISRCSPKANSNKSGTQ